MNRVSRGAYNGQYTRVRVHGASGRTLSQKRDVLFNYNQSPILVPGQKLRHEQYALLDRC